MEIDEFSNIFFQMEMKEGFFNNRTPNRDPFWDVVRFDIFFSLFEEINEPGQSGNSFARRLLFSWPTKIHKIPLKITSMANQWVRLKQIRPSDFVAYVCSRYSDTMGNSIDFASDDAFHALSEMGPIQRIESQHNLPRDLNINLLIRIGAHIYRLPTDYHHYFCGIAKVIANAEERYFGVTDPQLFSVICRTYKSHLIERRIWGEIFDHVRPRIVLMTQNGIQKGLIFEARRRAVPVIECQHGVINLMHPAYSYPSNLQPGETVILPDVLLLFSEYWKRQCHMPGTKMVVTGNNHFFSHGAHSSRNGAAVFVSAISFHKYLSPLAVKVAQLLPDRTFIMKLHPQQLSDRARIEREYNGIPNLVVVGMEKSCPELFTDASDVIIIQSTASYEALDRGIPVHILREDGYVSHQDLFAHPGVRVFSTAEELKTSLFKPVIRSERIYRFFDAFNPDVFHKLIQGLDHLLRDSERSQTELSYKPAHAPY